MAEMTTVKTIAVVAIIFGCFAVLYPKLFHPILLNIFGLSEPRRKDDISTYLPPPLRKPGMGKPHLGSPGMGKPDGHRPGMHGGPHPGMRAAAEMSKEGGGGGGRGMMGVVLPVYAIGIVCYLIYTLMKVFSSRKNEPSLAQRQKEEALRKLANIRYNAEKNKFTMGEEDSEVNDEEEENNQSNTVRKQQDLQRLLFKADKDKINDLEMRELKRRLAETEAQMARILEAMSTIQEKTEDVVDGQAQCNEADLGSVPFNPNQEQEEEEEEEIEEEIEGDEDEDEDYDEDFEEEEPFHDSDETESSGIPATASESSDEEEEEEDEEYELSEVMKPPNEMQQKPEAQQSDLRKRVAPALHDDET